MDDINSNSKDIIWKISISVWVVIVAFLAMLVFLFQDSLAWMVKIWDTREEYGYGYMIPVITLFLIWQRKPLLEKIQFTGSLAGVLVLLLGLCLFFLGAFSTIHTISQYAFLIVILGGAWSFMGYTGFRIVVVPLLFLAFMIPLPNFLLNNLSSKLQLISSELGVLVIRLFDISVYLEGNVIDLGSYKLQVVEACSGLNYLFPLMSLSFIMAYLYRASLWKRVIVFLSSIPITVLMNSFRIGVIGVLVEYWGQEQAEGFLHYFEGWIIFMACLLILVLEMWLLGKVGKDRHTLAEAFNLELPEPTPADVIARVRTLAGTFIVSCLFVLITTVAAATLEEREEIIPQRTTFDMFPENIGVWQGNKGSLESIIIDALKFDDYFIGDYVNQDGKVVNFYVAYYGSQRAGESAHSPRSCIPGGGWLIKSHDIANIDLFSDGKNILPVNRLLIQKEEHRQLVYYWFDQRGRDITNEYLVKWYLFWDSLTKNRSDGSLIRLTTFIAPGEDLVEADRQLAAFARDISGLLDQYIPK